MKWVPENFESWELIFSGTEKFLKRLAPNRSLHCSYVKLCVAGKSVNVWTVRTYTFTEKQTCLGWLGTLPSPSSGFKWFLMKSWVAWRKSSKNNIYPNSTLVPLMLHPRKIFNRLSKTMHSAASLRKKGKTLYLPLHAHSKHMGRREVLLGQGIF